MPTPLDIELLQTRRRVEELLRQKRAALAAKSSGTAVQPETAGVAGRPASMVEWKINMAWELAAKEGAEEVTLGEIAAALGVSRSTLHDHGITKAEARRRAEEVNREIVNSE